MLSNDHCLAIVVIRQRFVCDYYIRAIPIGPYIGFPPGWARSWVLFVRAREKTMVYLFG